uniref:PLAT domain-containing protein n=1 Tax=Coccolithus braarudii TaxID=221442 RepID=A0A7S0Q8M5_9EUKA
MVGDSMCWDGSTPGMQRGIFVVVAEANGEQRWSVRLGDMGFNYGKYGTQLKDGTVIIAGSKSVVDSHSSRMGFSYIEVRVLWRLDVNSGAVLSEATFPNEGKLQGLRDGFMCVTPTTDGTNDVVATGYVGGESNYDPATGEYDDEPMFLIYNGVAFAARYSYSNELHAAPATIFDVRLGLEPDFGYVPMQGMRIHMDAELNKLAVSAAACSGPYDDVWDMQFSLLSVDANTGELAWARRYLTGSASHPYAMTLSPAGDAEPGYIIAGHSMDSGRQPIGRLLKARSSDGAIVWDRSFTDRDDRYWNIECYGVDATLDGGYIVTCGNGPMTVYPWMRDCHQRTWTAFVYRADALGNPLWTANVTNSAELCLSDAGEHIVTARDGGYAVYVDSGTLGKEGTGGNFGLVLLGSDLAAYASE